MFTIDNEIDRAVIAVQDIEALQSSVPAKPGRAAA